MAFKLSMFMVCAIVVVISISICDGIGRGCGRGRDPYTGEEYGSHGRRCWHHWECCDSICLTANCMTDEDCYWINWTVKRGYKVCFNLMIPTYQTCINYECRWVVMQKGK